MKRIIIKLDAISCSVTLDVYVDSDLCLNIHIEAVTRSALFHLTDTAKLRDFMSKADL